VASHVINHIPTLSQTHTILHKSTELWRSSSASSSNEPTQFPFSFTLSAQDQELPQSSSIQLRRANAHIAYAVRVDMYRRGIHMNERYVQSSSVKTRSNLSTLIAYKLRFCISRERRADTANPFSPRQTQVTRNDDGYLFPTGTVSPPLLVLPHCCSPATFDIRLGAQSRSSFLPLQTMGP
jgi:hypothetical protein